MKRIIVTLLAVAMLLSCTLVFASCGMFAPKPEMDLEAAAENLEDEDYSVTHTDDEDYLSVNVAESLTARSEDGEDTLSIIVYKDSKSASIAYDQQKNTIDREIKSYELRIEYYENLIKKYEDDLDNDDIDGYEDSIKDLKKDLDSLKNDYVVGKSGKTVWYGTEAAIRNSKG